MNDQHDIAQSQLDLFGRSDWPIITKFYEGAYGPINPCQGHALETDKMETAIQACKNMDAKVAELKQEGGSKYDADKIRVELLDPLALEGLAKVLTFGAKKYAANNWRGGISYSRVLGGLCRHLFAVMRGEDIDPESGLPHVDHLGCCWMFLSNFMKTRPDLDDRWKPK